jgi:methionyl-tRNA formyltransferase
LSWRLAESKLASKKYSNIFGKEFADRYYQNSLCLENINSLNVTKVKDINCDDSILKIQKLNPDVVVCHGGVIYSEKFISSFPLVLNYHSGLSPIYNGTYSNLFACVNDQVDLCGGTLMLMNRKIDSGNILAHFLPKLNLHDSPSTIFLENMKGCSLLYEKFLDYYKKNQTFVSVPQPSTTFYTRSIDLTLEKLKKLEFNQKNSLVKKTREQKIISYWEESSEQNARIKLENTINFLK